MITWLQSKDQPFKWFSHFGGQPLISQLFVWVNMFVPLSRYKKKKIISFIPFSVLVCALYLACFPILFHFQYVQCFSHCWSLCDVMFMCDFVFFFVIRNSLVVIGFFFFFFYLCRLLSTACPFAFITTPHNNRCNKWENKHHQSVYIYIWIEMLWTGIRFDDSQSKKVHIWTGWFNTPVCFPNNLFATTVGNSSEFFFLLFISLIFFLIF